MRVYLAPDTAGSMSIPRTRYGRRHRLCHYHHRVDSVIENLLQEIIERKKIALINLTGNFTEVKEDKGKQSHS